MEFRNSKQNFVMIASKFTMATWYTDRLDRVRNEMLKCGINQLASSLVKLFNFIVKKGSFPDIWSTGIISPIFKSGNKSDPSNYRGICVTSCLGKSFSSVLNLRLSNFLQDQKILHPSQISFLRGYRTTDHIFSMRTHRQICN